MKKNGRLPSLTAVHSTRRHISENRKIERSYFQVNKTMKAERMKTTTKKTKQTKNEQNRTEHNRTAPTSLKET